MKTRTQGRISHLSATGTDIVATWRNDGSITDDDDVNRMVRLEFGDSDCRLICAADGQAVAHYSGTREQLAMKASEFLFSAQRHAPR